MLGMSARFWQVSLGKQSTRLSMFNTPLGNAVFSICVKSLVHFHQKMQLFFFTVDKTLIFPHWRIWYKGTPGEIKADALRSFGKNQCFCAIVNSTERYLPYFSWSEYSRVHWRAWCRLSHLLQYMREGYKDWTAKGTSTWCGCMTQEH